jgi:peptide chain release factor
MSKFKVRSEKEKLLLARMKSLGITESDLSEKFIKGSGKGGQKVNKTSSCVYLLHIPSGIEIKCQKERSQALNRYFARVELCNQLEEVIHREKSAKKQAEAKIRRQKRKRSKRAKEKMLKDKHKRSSIKTTRKQVGPNSED